LVEDYTTPKRTQLGVRQPCLITFSAPDFERLNALLEVTHAWLSAPHDEREEVNLYDLSRTLVSGRAEFDARIAFFASSVTEVRQTLKRFLAGDEGKVFSGHLVPGSSTVRLFADDEDLREAIEAWIRKGKLGLLAELWVNGVSIDWELLPDARFGRLIRMPSLPFYADAFPAKRRR
jgi:acyl transferase domain-containing protein